MSRLAAAVVSIVMIALVLSPLLRDPADDGYPLSTYPMFAWKRPTQLAMSYPVGETATGARRYLIPRLIGSGEVLQARAIVERAVARGQSKQLCQAVATRVAQAPRFADVVRIRVLSGTHESIAYLVDGTLGTEVERARCEVRR